MRIAECVIGISERACKRLNLILLLVIIRKHTFYQLRVISQEPLHLRFSQGFVSKAVRAKTKAGKTRIIKRPFFRFIAQLLR